MTNVLAPTTLFDRIVCAVDETDASLAAAAQARVLGRADGAFTLVAVAEIFRASRAGWRSTELAHEIERESQQALARAAAVSPEASTLLAHGHAANVILHSARRLDATLIAVGAARPPCARERLLGSIADDVVRQATCSVLVARACDEPVPGRIVCGTDGSPESLAAVAVGRELATRFHADLELVVASGGKGIDPKGVRPLLPEARLDSRPPVDALVDGALCPDLIVVGSRGIHGILSLGSVSARVAARAGCSVLVVRGSGG